jgi:predicted nucleic acid-binding protein
MAAEMFLFDTDIVSHVLKPKPSAALLRRLERTGPGEQFLSTIAIAELVYGALKSKRPDYHLRNLEEILLPAVQIVDFDVRAAYVAGEIRAVLEREGRPLAFADLQIAAVALANDLTLVTGNGKHFQRVPNLRMENWLE